MAAMMMPDAKHYHVPLFRLSGGDRDRRRYPPRSLGAGTPGSLQHARQPLWRPLIMGLA